MHRNIIFTSLMLIVIIVALFYAARLLMGNFEEKQIRDANLLGNSVVREIAESILFRTSITRKVALAYRQQIVRSKGLDLFLAQDIQAFVEKLVPDFEFSALVKHNGLFYLMDQSRPVGSACRMDIARFTADRGKSHFQEISLHGGQGNYHFDTMVRIPGNENMIFFVGYKLKEIISKLRHLADFGFEAIVVKRDSPLEIEFTADAMRKSLVYGEQLDVSLQDMILFKAAIPGTNWQLEVFPKDNSTLAFQQKIYWGLAVTIALTVFLYIFILIRMNKPGRSRMVRADMP